jgi:hypothetical protein
MNNLLGLMLILLISDGIFGCKHPEAESYYIPEGFKGRVNIIFNQPKGMPPRYENGRRVYQVPTNGILLTQFKDEYGIVDHQYYYVDGKGNRKPLPIFSYEYNKDGTIKWVIKDQHEAGIFFDGTTGGYGNENIKYQEFRVSDYSSLDSMESKDNFMKRVEQILKKNDFLADTLSADEMKKVDQRLNQKNK